MTHRVKESFVLTLQDDWRCDWRGQTSPISLQFPSNGVANHRHSEGAEATKESHQNNNNGLKDD